MLILVGAGVPTAPISSFENTTSATFLLTGNSRDDCFCYFLLTGNSRDDCSYYIAL